MRTLTIKGVPDAVYRRLKARAAERRRSLNSEVLLCLEQAVAAEPVDSAALLARADRVRERLNVPALTEAALRGPKSRGRP